MGHYQMETAHKDSSNVQPRKMIQFSLFNKQPVVYDFNLCFQEHCMQACPEMLFWLISLQSDGFRTGCCELTLALKIKSFIQHVLLWSFTFLSYIKQWAQKFKKANVIFSKDSDHNDRKETLIVLMGNPQKPWLLLPQDINKNIFFLCTLQAHRNVARCMRPSLCHKNVLKMWIYEMCI